MKPARLRLVVIFAVCIAVFLAAMFPLSLAAHWAGLARSDLVYTKAEGTIWDGRLTAASMGPYRLGDIRVGLKPFDLLLFRLRIDWRLEGGDFDGKGALVQGLGGLSARHTTLRADLARLPTIVPMTGEVKADIARLSFNRKGCRHALAQVETQAVIHYSDRASWKSPPLSGETGCRDGILELPLGGVGDGNDISLHTRLEPGGKYDIAIEVETKDESLIQAMTFLGFKEKNGLFSLKQQGIMTRRGLVPQTRSSEDGKS